MFPPALHLLGLALTSLNVNASPLRRQDPPPIPNVICDWTLRHTPNDTTLLDKNLIPELTTVATTGYNSVFPPNATIEVGYISIRDITKYEGEGIWGASIAAGLYNTTAGSNIPSKDAVAYSTAVVQVPDLPGGWDAELVSCRGLRVETSSDLGVEVISVGGSESLATEPRNEVVGGQPICKFNITPDEKSFYSGIGLRLIISNAVLNALVYTFENTTNPVRGVSTFPPTWLSVNSDDSFALASEFSIFSDGIGTWTPEDGVKGFESVIGVHVQGWRINGVECVLPGNV